MSEQSTITLETGIRYHYDLPPEFFALFLDQPTMSYSCAFFQDGRSSLEEAQDRKLELICRKLDLRPGMRVLDIGVGWGNMALRAAARGCRVVGMTLAAEQARYVERLAAAQGLSDMVDVRVEEAHTLPFADGSFDRVVTIGATEHISDIETLFAEVRRVLRPDGLFLQHAITCPVEPTAPSVEEEFMRQYIFPVGQVKPMHRYVTAHEQAGLEVIDVHDISDHYTLTLASWLANLEAAGVEASRALGVPDARFHAQRLFLAGCIASFSESHSTCHQQLARPITLGAYRTPLPAGRRRYVLDQETDEPLPRRVHDRPLVAVAVPGVMEAWVQGMDGTLQVGNPPRQPDCRISISVDTFQQMSRGELPLPEAFLQGRVEVEGDLVAAVQVRRALLGLAAGSTL